MEKYKHESLVDYYKRRPEANTGGTPVGTLGSMHLNVFYLDGHYPQGAYKRRNFSFK